MKPNISKTENIVLKKIENLFKIKIQRQFELDGKFYDGKYKKYLLEIDGVAWHSKPEQILNDELKNIIAKKNNYKLIRIRIPTIKSINVCLLSKHKILSEMANQ
jgi:very-short-patch-repair endonuclease